MKIRVRFFASIRDLVGEPEMNLELEIGAGIKELESVLEQHLGPKRWSLLEERLYKVAVNQSLIDITQKLNEGDEVAFLPQVTGG